MAQASTIEWTDATWNPIRGCSRISAGCGGANHEGGCYAEKIAARFSGPGQAYHGLAERSPHGGRWTGKVVLVEEMLDVPLRWHKGRRIFANSMSDMFHDELTDEMIDSVFAVMAMSPQHTFQVLTKRAERMQAYFTTRPIHQLARDIWRVADDIACNLELNDRHPSAAYLCAGADAARMPLANVWLGVSVEDQAAADSRIPHLLVTPAAVRFLSCEPLLGPVRLDRFMQVDGIREDVTPLHVLDWVIAGGESGPRKRPIDVAWLYDLRDQCQAAGVPFFAKQIDKVQPVPADLMIREFPAVTP